MLLLLSQSAAIKNRINLHTLSIICDMVDVSNKLNKVDWDFIFSA